MKEILFAGVGGMVGTMLRFLLNNFIYRLFTFPYFPYGTLVINIVGCLLIGMVTSLSEHRITIPPEIRIFLQIGILGGFTTFSTFGYETFQLFRDGEMLFAMVNILTQVIVGIVAVWLGYQICR